MKKKTLSSLLVICIPLVVFLVFKLLQPNRFGTADGIFILIQQSMLPSVTACGLYFIVVMGLWDFSVGANIILCSIVGVTLYGKIGMPGLILGGIVVGTLVGLINGITYIKLKIPSIIVTVGMMMFYECFGMVISGGGIVSLPSEACVLGTAPWNIVGCLAAFILTYFILAFTKIGEYATAIGGNETAAANMGINVSEYKLIGFVLCGMFVGISSVLTISYSSSISPQLSMASMDRNFLPLMGCFVGLAFRKYINPVISIFIGEFTISMLISGLMTNGIDSTLQKCVIGVTLLLIVFISAASIRRQKNMEIVVK